MSRFFPLQKILLVSLCISYTSCFTAPARSGVNTKHRQHNGLQLPSSRSNSQLAMSNNGFDISKPTFDLFSLRSIRQDAMISYSSRNQSEPLRINLYLIAAVALFSFPTLSEAVIGEQAELPAIVASTAAGVGAVALFFKECNNRLKQLMRIEKELNAETLSIKLATTNKFDDVIYGRSQPVLSLKTLRGNKRILVICGPSEKLKEILVPFRTFRRRIAQAGSIIAVVPTDSMGDVIDTGPTTDRPIDLTDLGVTETELRSCQWVGQVQDVKSWVNYCQTLTDVSNDTPNSDDLIWFGLNYNGRSFASASNEDPRLLEILGQNLRPAELLDETDENEGTTGMNEDYVKLTNNILKSQQTFYKSLTEGDLNGMKSIFSSKKAEEISEIVDTGGRIDAWESCLVEDARPAGMVISGSDALIVSPTKAFTTCIEFPANVGGYSDPSGATLLANQRWGRRSPEEEWKLEYHQTIPWSPDTRAGGTLRCDSRGCVALTRGKEKRTFGGLIG